MSYDFTLCPKRHPSEIVAGPSDARKDPAKEALKSKTAAALLQLNPNLAVFDYDFDLLAQLENTTVDEARSKARPIELNIRTTDTMAVQIVLDDDTASISIPYSPATEQLASDYRLVWKYLETICAITSYTANDDQLHPSELDLAADFQRSFKNYIAAAGFVRQNRWKLVRKGLCSFLFSRGPR